MSVNTDSMSAKPVEQFSANRNCYFSLNLGICRKIYDALRTSEFGNPLTFPQVQF